MTFFARTTTRAPRAGTTNAVIMGRKTYMSVPGKLRPLKGRVNVVVSRGGDGNGNGGLREGVLGELKRRKEALQQQQEKQGSSGDGAGNKDEVEPTDALVARGLDAALASLEETYGSKERLGRIFVIGGAEVYASALQMHGRSIRIVMTNVRRKATDAASGDGFECDTFFPVDEFAPESGWRAASAEEVSDWVGERVSGEWRDEGEVLIQMVGYERAG
jgi:dihydrofolate reductase